MKTKLHNAEARPASIQNRRPTNKDMELGFQIRRLRQNKSLSLDSVAAILGISRQQLRKYELGRNRISAQRLKEIADILNVSVNQIIASGTSLDTEQEIVRIWSNIENAQHKAALLNLIKIVSGETS